MSTLRKRNALMKTIGMRMLEEGRFLTRHEYNRLKTIPISSSFVLKHFGSWSRFLSLLRRTMPDLCTEIDKTDPLSQLAKAGKAVKYT